MNTFNICIGTSSCLTLQKQEIGSCSYEPFRLALAKAYTRLFTCLSWFNNILSSRLYHAVHFTKAQHRTPSSDERLSFPSFSLSCVEVCLGKNNIEGTEGKEQFITSSQVIPHPNYSSYNINNDIMLIKPATLNTYVQPVALPSRSPTCSLLLCPAAVPPRAPCVPSLDGATP